MQDRSANETQTVESPRNGRDEVQQGVIDKSNASKHYSRSNGSRRDHAVQVQQISALQREVPGIVRLVMPHVAMVKVHQHEIGQEKDNASNQLPAVCRRVLDKVEPRQAKQDCDRDPSSKHKVEGDHAMLAKCLEHLLVRRTRKSRQGKNGQGRQPDNQARLCKSKNHDWYAIV